MIMSAMREKTKVVLIVVLLAFVGFIFFDWGMQAGSGRGAAPDVIGRVNGRDITNEAYRRTRQQIVETFEARTGRDPELADYDAIDEETWLSLVRESLLQQEIEKHGISVSDAEILEMLRTDPPSVVRQQFTNEEGQFDVQAYQAALANPALAPQWASVESYLRAMLPAEKLQNYVGLNARVTNAEVRERFLAKHEKARARFVASVPADVQLSEGAVTDEKIRAWYDAHLADYAVAEQAVLEMVRVSKVATAADSAATREDLVALRAQIAAGTTSFEEVANAYSDDPSAERGGDLGFFGRGEMVPEFDRVAFATPIGQVSDVFASPFGYHILKVEERKTEDGKERVRARHVLLRIEPANETLRAASDRVEDFLSAVNEDGKSWAVAAQEAGLSIETTTPFAQSEPIPGIGLLRAANRFAFTAAPGTVVQEPLEDETAFYAFRLVERRPPGTAPFEDVKDRARAAVDDAERRALARKRLEDAIAKGDGSLESIARAMGASVDTTGEFTRESFVRGVGVRNAFVATAFAQEVGNLSGLVESDRGYYALQVSERIPADETKLAEEASEIRRTILVEKREQLITTWIEELLAKAEIVDFRSGTGVPWKPDETLFQYLRPTVS